MEIGNHAIYRFKCIAGINENLCPAASCMNDTIFICHRFQCSGAGSTNSNDSAAIFSGFIHDCRLIFFHHIIFGMHFMIQNIFCFYRTESTQTYMECHMGNLYAHFFNFLQQFRCKMKSCCGRCCRTIMFCIYSLIAFFIFQFMCNVRRQRHFAQFIQNIFKNTFVIEFNDTVAAFNGFQHFRCQSAVTKGNFITRTSLFTGTYQYFPCVNAFPHQKEHFNMRASAYTFSMKSGRQYSCIIDNQTISRFQIFFDIPKMFMGNRFCILVSHQQSGRRTIFQRFLGDQFFW